jgi:RNA polymerase sigma factor (sigma-70 family)
MHDSEVVAAIVAGDPDGLAEAYDRYASALYTYCRSLLHEPADAADAVQDTFVIAASRLAALRDPQRLRPWLYAVARNECRRRQRERAIAAPAAMAAVPEVTDESADVTSSAERAELRTLLRSAVRGLGAGEQDLIELQLRQELDVAEVASALGVTRNHAHALLSRARDQLEVSLGALLVARSGRDDCAALGALLQGWDGQLNVLMRKRINRHIERCPACTDRKRRELAPALLLGLAPLAALPLAAAPAGLRAQVLKLAGSNTPAAVAHRAAIGQHTAPFGPLGFPKPVHPPRPWWRTGSGQAAAVAGAATIVAAVALTAAALTGGLAGQHGQPVSLGLAPGTGASIVLGATPGASGRAHPGGTGDPARPGGSGRGLTGGSPGPGPGSGPGAGSGPGRLLAPEPASGASAAAGSPQILVPETGSSQAAASPAASAVSSAATSTATATKPAAQGTLSVSPATILINEIGSATLTLTAAGGPVTWSITEPSSLLGTLSVSSSSGTLASGQSTTVTLSASGLALDSTLTVNPGDQAVSVVLSLGL